MLGLEGGVIAVIAGLVGGAILGLAARLGRFCMMGAVEDAVYGGDTGRMRMLGIAAAAAIAGTALLAMAGALDPAETIYLRLGWSPAASALGGLMFGYGMAQVGTCGFGALARLGGGDLRSFVMVLIIGIAGFATLSGPLEPLRTALAPAETMSAGQPGLPALVAGRTGLDPSLTALAVAAALALLALGDRRFRRSRGRIGWGLAAGGAIVLAWGLTALAARTGFDAVPVQSFSFVHPLGETVMLAMTGRDLGLPDFAFASVVGVVAGAAAGSLWRGEFRWEACDDARELRRQMLGAALMGIGGVLALGCSVGQGLSALSVLSASAPVTILAIFAGARLGLYMLVEGVAVSR